jgi:hypothetical protein
MNPGRFSLTHYLESGYALDHEGIGPSNQHVNTA